MVAELGDSKRENISEFPLDKISNGRWFAYVDLTANRKKGIANTVGYTDGIFSASVFAVDIIPSPIPYSFCFIMNADKHGQPSEHWVSIFL